MKEVLKKIIWRIRYIDVVYPLLFLVPGFRKLGKEEKEMFIRAIYDLDYLPEKKDLEKHKKLVLELFILNVVVTLLLFLIHLILVKRIKSLLFPLFYFCTFLGSTF